MILSHKYKFIFIHVGRTGGTSIEQTLSSLIGMNFQKTQRNDEVLPGRDCKHLSASQVKKIVGDEIWNEYFTFGFVRNPYERLLSGWTLEKSLDGVWDWVDPQWTRYGTFEEFLDALAADEDGKISAHDTQLAMLADEKGEILVDFIGRFERLQEDFESVCQKIGLPRTRLCRMADSSHRPWPAYYTPQREEVLKQRFRADFAAFGYPGKVPRQERAAAKVTPGDRRADGVSTRLYRFEGQVIGSIGQCLDLLARDPTDVEALVLLGDCYNALGAFESAEALFARARDLAPDLATVERKLTRSALAGKSADGRF